MFVRGFVYVCFVQVCKIVSLVVCKVWLKVVVIHIVDNGFWSVLHMA